MTSVLLAVAWGALALLVAARRRPLPRARSGLLWPEPPPRRRPPRLSPLLERVGRAARGVARRPADPAADRRAGTVLLAAATGLIVDPLLGAGLGAAVWWWPAVRAHRAAKAHRWAVLSALPDAVDLLVVAVGAGHNVRLAVGAVGPRAPPPVGPAMREVTRRVDRGEPLGDALERMPGHLGDTVRPLVTVLVTAERYGAPLLPSLERLAVDVRSQRRRAAEEAARRVPVKLLFPLVLLVLPAFALLTVAPLLAGALQGLRL